MNEQERDHCANLLGDHRFSDTRQQAFSNVISLPKNTRELVLWTVILLLALSAWIPTLQQAQSMPSMPLPMVGTMGMSLGPFLLFWTIMMIAMMFPALAPAASGRYEMLRRQARTIPACFHLLLFLLGYLLIWTLFGLPVFFLSLLSEHLVIYAPVLSIGLNIALLGAIGLYQITPLEKHCLSHCNPTLKRHTEVSSPPLLLSHLKTGLLHGISCLGCCGGLMLVMVVVGLMNLPWMVLLTIVIFVEKTWQYGDRLSFFIGIGFIIVALFVFIDPMFLSSLSLS